MQPPVSTIFNILLIMTAYALSNAPYILQLYINNVIIILYRNAFSTGKVILK